MMGHVFDEVVGTLGEQLVLVDVGASGGTPGIWKNLARHSLYVGFDPDAREIREAHGGDFARAVYLPKAVTGKSGGDVRFYLTRSPYCSSTLVPNTQVTESFLSAERFIVEGETSAAATTVAEALAALGLSRVDWLKIDTQGTDLSIFAGLPDDMRAKVLAADLEPGLRGAYVGEELFSDVHGFMVRDGFWLSKANVLGFPRLRKATLDRMRQQRPDVTEAMVEANVRKTPGWVECRYLRTLESLAARADATRRDYLVLWAFAFADQQFGYCLDVAGELARRFASEPLPEVLTSAALERIDGSYARRQAAMKAGLLARVKRKIKSIIVGSSPTAKAAASQMSPVPHVART